MNAHEQIALAVRNTRNECRDIAEACFLFGDLSLAQNFILSETPLAAVKRALGEMATAKLRASSVAIDGKKVSVNDLTNVVDIHEAIKASGRPW